MNKLRKSSVLRALILVLLISMVFASCEDEPETEQKDNAFEASAEAKLDDFFTKRIEELKLPGAIAGIRTDDGSSWLKPVGLSDLENERKMTAGKKFRIGGITRTFTSTIIMQLSEEGLLRLDDPIEHYFPGAPNGRAITVQHLLSNRSGLFDYVADENIIDAIMNDRKRQFGKEELLDASFSRRTSFKPGAGWEISNTNYLLLGMIIETVCGNTFENVCYERIINPLNLRNTGFPENDDPGIDYSRGYRRESDGSFTDTTEMNVSWGWASSNMVSDVEDMHIWVEALAKGELLSESSRARMRSWINIPGASGIEGKYGLGLMSVLGLIGHDGALPGYTCCAFYDPSRKASFVIMLNSFSFTNGREQQEMYSILMTLAETVFPGFLDSTYPRMQ